MYSNNNRLNVRIDVRLSFNAYYMTAIRKIELNYSCI